MEEKSLVSIIIPVYNVAAYIEECLRSLYQQTYRHLELIFVDDCCQDETVSLIQTYTSQYKEEGVTVKIIQHEHNRGVAAARNTGLKNATGEYLYYVDADDKIEQHTIERLVKKAVETQADIVGCEWYLSYYKNERRMPQPDVNSPNDAFYQFATGRLRWNLWLFLVRRSLYTQHQIAFIEGLNMGEDMMVMGKLLLCADKVVVLHEPLYHYVQINAGSLTKEASERHRFQVTENLKELETFAKRRNEKDIDTYLQFLKLSIKLPLLMSDKTADYERWLEWFPEANAYIFQNRSTPLRIRLLQFCAVKRYFFFLKLYYRFVFRFIYGVLYK